MKMSTGVAAMKMPRQPADDEHATRTPGRLSIGVVNWMLPRQIVPSQLKTFTAEGRAIMMVAIMKPVPRRGSMPHWNM